MSSYGRGVAIGSFPRQRFLERNLQIVLINAADSLTEMLEEDRNRKRETGENGRKKIER
jgi:hypothetical protein